jgi:hypothetical protein
MAYDNVARETDPGQVTQVIAAATKEALGFLTTFPEAKMMDQKSFQAASKEAREDMWRVLRQQRDLVHLARALVLTIEAMDTRDAASVSDEAALRILDAMGKTTNSSYLRDFAESLSRLCGRLPRSSASKITSAAITRIVSGMQKTKAPMALRNFAVALDRLTRKMSDSEAANLASTAASVIVSQMEKVSDVSELRLLADALGKLSKRMGQKEAAKVDVFLAMKLRKAPDARDHVAAANKLDVHGLVDLLKNPEYVGKARLDLLQQLGQRAGTRFRGIWDFVHWAQVHQPTVDLCAPPERRRP